MAILGTAIGTPPVYAAARVDFVSGDSVRWRWLPLSAVGFVLFFSVVGAVTV